MCGPVNTGAGLSSLLWSCTSLVCVLPYSAVVMCTCISLQYYVCILQFEAGGTDSRRCDLSY
jgi:hypothetical protein